MQANGKKSGKRPNCIKCIHYYVTHIHNKPHGCRAMGFKCIQNPAVLVFSSSHMECQLFQAKPSASQNKKGRGSSGGGIVA
ncbi:MAG: uracil-DNA glycosylase [Desulfocapsa sp.]|nr:MAG: uracil-DNA glycosylase [Desulfocapsa sp.]